MTTIRAFVARHLWADGPEDQGLLDRLDNRRVRTTETSSRSTR